MPLDNCNVCCNPDEWARNDLSYKTASLRTLCDILTAISAEVGACDCVTDGQVVAAPTTGSLVLGTDGTNYQVLSTNASGQLNVNVLSVIPGTGATNLGKAEDAAAVSGDTGVAMLAVQTATPASTAADGDYGWIKTDALGKLWTADSQVEDLGHTTGDRGSFILGVRNDTAAAFTTTDLDYSPIAVDSAGRLQIAASSLTIGSIASITTSVTPGTAASNLGKAEDAAHASGDTGVFALGVRNTGLVTYGADQDYAPVGVGTYGESLATLIHDNQLSQGISAIRLEDSAHTSGDAGVPAWAVNNEALGITFNSTAGDYTPICVDRYGRQAVFSVQGSGGASLLKDEDAVAASGDAGVMTLGVIQATPAASAADGDYGAMKLNAVGAQFTEPSNQVGTYGGTTTAGAAGGVATTGTSVHTNAAKAKIITIRNKLDVDVQISLDAGTTYIAYVAINENLILDLGTNGRWTASNIFAKAITSNSAAGNIYVGTII